MPTQPRTLEEFNLNVVTLYVHYATLCFCKRIGTIGLLLAQLITHTIVLGKGNFSDEEIRFSFVYFYHRRINEQL